MDAELEQVVQIGRKAAEVVRAVYATPFTVELKGPGDIVTRADREANDLICVELARAFPGAAIVAEESCPKDQAELKGLVESERVFFVDPLDGTREFANKNGEFAVMIGLSVRGKAELGVVVLPTTGEALFGRVSTKTAVVEDSQGNRKALAVSEVDQPKDARLVVSRSHRPRIIEPLLRELGIFQAIPCGSVGVKVARVATGAADLYVHAGGGAKAWDTCAPEAILRAAGGSFTDLWGEPLNYANVELEQVRGMVASNGKLHARVIAVTSNEPW